MTRSLAAHKRRLLTLPLAQLITVAGGFLKPPDATSAGASSHRGLPFGSSWTKSSAPPACAGKPCAKRKLGRAYKKTKTFRRARPPTARPVRACPKRTWTTP